jgi:uncharacterized membrane protein SirB2
MQTDCGGLDGECIVFQVFDQVKGKQTMRILLNIIAVVLIIAGGVWILQGIGILGGSVMTGQTQWAIYGSLAALVGIVLLVFANRRKQMTQ